MSDTAEIRKFKATYRFTIMTCVPVAKCGDCGDNIYEFHITDGNPTKLLDVECEQCEQNITINIDALSEVYNRFSRFLGD